MYMLNTKHAFVQLPNTAKHHGKAAAEHAEHAKHLFYLYYTYIYIYICSISLYIYIYTYIHIYIYIYVYMCYLPNTAPNTLSAEHALRKGREHAFSRHQGAHFSVSLAAPLSQGSPIIHYTILYYNIL